MKDKMKTMASTVANCLRRLVRKEQGVETQEDPDWGIKLTKGEIQSGLDRVRYAELLIKQLPEDHDGRNTWLLNYGEGRRKDYCRLNSSS